MTLVTRTKARIYGTTNSWSLSPLEGHSAEGRECELELAIEGDDKQGYHLIMSPTGFFTADYWYATQDEAVSSASELFGVSSKHWIAKKRDNSNG